MGVATADAVGFARSITHEDSIRLGLNLKLSELSPVTRRGFPQVWQVWEQTFLALAYFGSLILCVRSGFTIGIPVCLPFVWRESAEIARNLVTGSATGVEITSPPPPRRAVV